MDLSGSQAQVRVVNESFGRAVPAFWGFLAGLLAAVLSILLPQLVIHVRWGAWVAAFFGELIGDIFGLVLAIYIWLSVAGRPVWRAIGFVSASTLAYPLAGLAGFFFGRYYLESRGCCFAIRAGIFFLRWRSGRGIHSSPCSPAYVLKRNQGFTDFPASRAVVDGRRNPWIGRLVSGCNTWGVGNRFGPDYNLCSTSLTRNVVVRLR